MEEPLSDTLDLLEHIRVLLCAIVTCMMPMLFDRARAQIPPCRALGTTKVDATDDIAILNANCAFLAAQFVRICDTGFYEWSDQY